MEARRRDAAATREAILAAAVAAFADRGYRAVTVRQIAAAAGVDPALVLRYFGSKADLFVEGLGTGGTPDLAAVIEGPVAGLAGRLAAHFAGKSGSAPMTMLALSAADPDGRALLARLADEGLERPVAACLVAAGVAADAARARARAVTAVLMGEVLVAAVWGEGPGTDVLAGLLDQALQGP